MGRSLDPGVVGRRLVVGSDLAGRSLGLHSHTAEAHTQEEARNRGVARILGLHSPAEGHKSHNLVAAGSRRKQAVAAHSPAGDRILEGGTPPVEVAVAPPVAAAGFGSGSAAAVDRKSVV